jgi:heme exporter protein A
LKAEFADNNQLEAISLECLRGFHTLFSELSFTLVSGEALQIAGANGSGKTSLLRILCGLSLMERGGVYWNGQDIRSNAMNYRTDLSYLGHRPGLKGELTPRENLRALTTIRGKRPDEPEISRLLESMGIRRHHERPCRTLSAGQQQRTAIARVILSDAPLWILDEPATALDDAGVTRLAEAMADHLGVNGMILFTSHMPIGDSSGIRQLTLTGGHE